MSMPDTATGQAADGPSAAVILLELGKQGTQLAVIGTKLDSLISAKDDHEARLRLLEGLAQQNRGGRDVLARVAGGVAIGAAVAAGVAPYLHH